MIAQTCESDIRTALDSIEDPCSVAVGLPLGLAEMGLVERVEFAPGSGLVRLHLRLTSPTCMMAGYFATRAQEVLRALPGIEAVQVQIDQGLDWTPDMMTASAQQRRQHSLDLRLTESQVAFHGKGAD